MYLFCPLFNSLEFILGKLKIKVSTECVNLCVPLALVALKHNQIEIKINYLGKQIWMPSQTSIVELIPMVYLII